MVTRTRASRWGAPWLFACSGFRSNKGTQEMKRRLFVDEHELRSLGNITLTTHRVIVHAKHGSGRASTSLLLDGVQWTRLRSGPQPELTAATIALGVLGVVLSFEGLPVLGTASLVLGLLSGLVDVSWRRTAVVIGSGSARIKTWLDGDPERSRQARSFLDAVDHAAALAREDSAALLRRVSFDAARQ